jgi:hypothetical protein
MNLDNIVSSTSAAAPTVSLSPLIQRRSEDGIESASMVSVAPSIITNSGIPTDEQFEDIRSRFGDPRANVKPSDYFSFRLIASGDGLDSYFTKQDVETSFANFVRNLREGQSILGSHQMGTFSYGSSYTGYVEPADESRSEYEPTFYPQWDRPELRTRNWLIGDYFMGRGVTVNNQSTDDLIRSIELGNVRKVSISFMVGQYVCGIDGRELVPSFLGFSPDEECNHFPGVAYDGKVAWALMKNNTLVETSLVYKNASPSAMLLRKAETMATRGMLSVKDIEKLEGRFQVRLPRFERQMFLGTTTQGNTAFTLQNPTDVATQEDLNMAKRRGADATRELLREALTADEVPEEEPADDAPEAGVTTEQTTADDRAATEPTPETAPEEVPEETTDDVTADEPEVEAATEEETPAENPAPDTTDTSDADTEDRTVTADVSEHKGHKHEGDSKGGHARPKAVESETTEEEDPKPETTPEEDAVAAFVSAADRLAGALARNPDAFDSGQMAMAARSERALDLALVDAGCDTTASTHVARTFETRSKAVRDTLGEPITVEAVRSLQSKAQLGETLFEELVKDAVAARTGAQGESFNAPKYREVLLTTRDVAFVKEEIESWQQAKKDRFTPGRQVIPRAPVEARVTKEERKTLPAPPAASAKSASPMSILEPRKK